MSHSFKEEALRFHRYPTAGKISVVPTKTLDNQRDLSLAYSPGVAYACEAIEEDPLQADYLTARGNLVAVISNGTAVLGLGNIGALAGKPVMEGKGVLFKNLPVSTYLISKSTKPIRINSSKSLPALSQRLVALTLKTSKRQSASRLKSASKSA